MRWFAVEAAVAALWLAMMVGPAHATTYELHEPDNFQNPAAGEQPAISEYPDNYWQADPSIGNDQHLIYVQGGKPGTTPDADYGRNPQLLWDDPAAYLSGSNDTSRPDEAVTLAEIRSLNWTTRKDSGVRDWFVDVFTHPDYDLENDGGNWYGRNFDFTPGPDSGKNTWTVEDGFWNQDTFDEYTSVTGPDAAGDARIMWVALGTGSYYGDFTGKLYDFSITYESDHGGTKTATVNFTSTPEPATMGLLGLGVVGLAAVGYARSRRS